MAAIRDAVQYENWLLVAVGDGRILEPVVSSLIYVRGAEMLIQGQEYRRRDLHEQYGGQQQGGISTPREQKIIFHFTGDSGEEYGYSDGWADDGTFLYTGEGTRGDMVFRAGNKAIRDHQQNGKDLCVFEYTRVGYVRFIGQMVYVGFQYKVAPDLNGAVRQAIVFVLNPVGFTAQSAFAALDVAAVSKDFQKRSLDELRTAALAASTENTNAVERRATYRHRSRAIKCMSSKGLDRKGSETRETFCQFTRLESGMTDSAAVGRSWFAA